MKRWISIWLIVAIFGIFLSESDTGFAQRNEKVKEYIIVAKDVNEYQKLIRRYDENVIERFEGYEDIKNTSFVAELTKSEVSDINSGNSTIAVEENVEVNALRKRGKKKEKILNLNNSNWNLQMIGVDKIKIEKPKAKDVVKIAIMDSGIDPSEDVNVVHRVNLVEQEQEITTFLEDVTGHGTSIAGVISDINPYADIYSVRILNRENKGKLSEVINGIYWCIENNIDIINMSFGINKDSEALQMALQDAESAGILMFAAVGNDGEEGMVNYPAAYSEVVAVGAVDSMAEKTEESNVGDSVEIVAPGNQILTDGAYGGDIVVGGTSIAVPHVVGCASLIWQKNKEKTSDFIRTVLSVSTKELGAHKKYGNGLVDVEYAMDNYESYCQELKAGESTEVKSLPQNENTNPVEVFDDVDLVEGKWYTYSGVLEDAGKTAGHYAIIDNSGVAGTSHQILLIIKQSSAFADGLGTMNDKNRNLMKYSTQLVLHGRHNYVATLNYLYDIARKLYFSDSNVNVERVCHECEYNIDFGNYYYYVTVRDRLTEAVKFICHPTTLFWPRYNTNDIPINKQYAYRVLGLAAHLTGDVYAHKTRVPTSVYPSGTAYENGRGIVASDLTITWNEFKKKVDDKMTFSQIKGYIRENGGKKRNYEDEPTFYPARFTAAQSATRKLFEYFFGGKKTLEADKVFQQNTATECKCAFLDKYVEDVYGKQKVAGCANYKFTPAKRDGWVDEWVNLPYLSGK